jgi:hypothetical protein
MKEITLTQYRAAIRDAWSQIVGRRRFSSHEYLLTEEWFEAKIPVRWVLRAIDQVRSRKATVYSLGVIKADLEGIQREQARLCVGGPGRERRDSDPQSWNGGGRQALGEGLEEMAARESIDPECRVMIMELIRDLEGLNHDQAWARFGEIHRCLRR